MLLKICRIAAYICYVGLRKIVLLSLFCLASSSAFSQCMLVPVDLKTLSNSSERVVEGNLKYHTSFIHTTGHVYSVFRLLPSFTFKGLISDTVYIVSRGGSFGNIQTVFTPSDELESCTGLFFLKRGEISNSYMDKQAVFELTATAQGKIVYFGFTPQDVFGRYSDLNLLREEVAKYCGMERKLPEYSVKPSGIKRLTPVVNSVVPSSRTAGTDSTVTIYGTNFNSSQGTGLVGFRNANNGGAGFIAPPSSAYISWNDTMIVLKVPTQTGSGTIYVQNSDPSALVSTVSLTVPYNLLNVNSGGVYYRTRLQGLNTGASLSFSFNTRFNDSAAAKRDFVNAMDAWRCKSLVNFDTFASTSSKTFPAYDSVNLVCWDFNSALSAGVLAVAISTFLTCNGSDWFVIDLDIIFNDIPFTSYTWDYGSSTPGSTEFDFESVAVHELGHGHQLGHVIDNTKVMHYALSNGQKNTSISINDSLGAKNVMNRNVSSVCSQTAMTALNSGTCSFIPLAFDLFELNGFKTGNAVELEWNVINSNDVREFRVEKSMDETNYQEIAVIPSRPYSGILSTYSFTDHSASNIHSCYRIHGIENNAFSEYSNTVCFNGNLQMPDLIYTGNKSFRIQYSTIADTDIKLQFYNSLGQVLESFESENKLIRVNAGENSLIYVLMEYGNRYQFKQFLLY